MVAGNEQDGRRWKGEMYRKRRRRSTVLHDVLREFLRKST